jgi:hypothetical protein
MAQPIHTYRESPDKDANTMASNDVEVLDPGATAEKLPGTSSGPVLNRRHFMAALGVAGAAASAGLGASSAAFAQQPTPNGYLQTDVLNFLLNIKYLKATFYSYLISGKDLLPAATIGTALVDDIPGTSVTSATPPVVSGAPTVVSLTGTTNATQIADLLNEMYYDELNQVIDLRNLLGNFAVSRPTLNLLGTGVPPSATAATYTLTATKALSMARVLEDLSASAFAGAAIYLSGANLACAAQILGSDGFHAGAIRLVCIQNAIPYQATSFVTTFSGSTTSASPIIYGVVATIFPTVGQVVQGAGIPANATVIAVASGVSATPIGVVTSTSKTIGTVSSTTGLAVGQIISGTGIPANTVIAGITSNTITLSAAATVSSTVAPTGVVTANSQTVTAVSNLAGVLVGQTITGTGIPTGTTITGISASPNTITMSVNATATSLVALAYGNTTAGSPILTAVAATTITTVLAGQPISGVGIPAGTTIMSVNTVAPYTITMSKNATATIVVAEALTISGPETLTIPTTETLTIATGSVTLSANATATATPVIFTIVTADPEDVFPADPGTAAAAAAGPAAIPGTTPPIYQGFFETAGAATGSGSTPGGFAFARTFSQVLSVLYNGTTTPTVQDTSGGYFPNGVAGNINAV